MSEMTTSTPVTKRSFSPRPYIAAGYASVFLGFGVFGTWAATAPLASGVVAHGVVSVEGNRKTIQHLEGGIVSDIVIKEGDVVNQGDILIKLDPTQAMGNYTVWSTKLLYLEAAEARLVAEAKGGERIEFPESLLNSQQPEAKAAMSLQQNILETRMKTRDGQVAILKSRIEQLSKATDGLSNQLKAIDKQVASMNEEIDRMNNGLKNGAVAINQLSQMTRQQLEMQRVRGEADVDLARIRETISETELQIVQTKQEFADKAVSEHKEVRAEIEEVRERARVAKDVLERTTVRAPVRGMVQNIRVHTTNGVIRPAEQLLDIVPLDDDLLVNAQVRPIDIDSVTSDAKVEVRFSAFSSKTTPAIYGEVSVLGRDVIQPEGNREAYYQALVRVDDQNVPPEIKGRIVAGMPVDVIISTGERTFAQYLTKPLIDSFHKSMKEK
ncbi:HlyD family type I secretion periplasmic adaptor subunit [Agrobacterium genomosp. 3]|uniref:HlyD family type I secretion periplasmic adaptor subunit n=1 Tax=Agrobacterium tomkonis TaxID=1183410 RepID=UPI001CD8D9DD|nr:HlyD family type I secretion periplasmic adaptor subunit [Agrobacterium tomkonis]MCA1879528.1 HlyD family type I secretion periplasmic adaptor subunit [Agrobacterium tumefaciens]MCA1894746.1 HlyD family type I secretion periplasmic adaptor subunit [Agrobacterium tomkonis]